MTDLTFWQCALIVVPGAVVAVIELAKLGRTW